MSYTEADIKYEGEHFFVISNRARERFEVCKKGITHATVVGYSDKLESCLRTAKRLERYHDKVN